jgi:catechol 2,3-dioxygenase-like lactoylglutathione lyase family enzyme
MQHVECLLQRFDAYRGARITRADHVNFYVPDVAPAYEYYRGLGFRCSEYIATDRDDRLVAAWLYRKPTVHDVALTTGRGPRMHHFAFTTAETSAITGLCDILAGARREAAIERGPGRHSVSNAFFVYLRDRRAPDRALRATTTRATRITSRSAGHLRRSAPDVLGPPCAGQLVRGSLVRGFDGSRSSSWIRCSTSDWLRRSEGRETEGGADGDALDGSRRVVAACAGAARQPGGAVTSRTAPRPSEIDGFALRSCLARFARCRRRLSRGPDGPRGVTVNSFTAVSLEPRSCSCRS